MRPITTISGHHGARRMVAAAFWIVVGIVAMIAFGDILTLLAVALAMVTTAWWIGREVEHRVKRNGARRYATGVGSRADHRAACTSHSRATIATGSGWASALPGVTDGRLTVGLFGK
jgi:hypothetical protein